MDDGEFSWDDNKAASNYTKHGVSFEAATDVFKDPFAVDWLDGSENYGEIRYRITGVGEAAGLILFVAYTMRDDVTRIISAREASNYEKKRYYEENSY